jgi:hypothetical protein
MTQRFILDENVFICAQLETNTQGEPDPTCLELLQRILDICHPIVLDPELYEKILRQLNLPAHQRRGFGAAVLRTLASAGFRPGKLDIRQEAQTFAEEESIPQGSQDDKYIVRLAVESGATLVTADEALRDDLASCSIQARYGLRVLSPEGAIADLCAPYPTAPGTSGL